MKKLFFILYVLPLFVCAQKRIAIKGPELSGFATSSDVDTKLDKADSINGYLTPTDAVALYGGSTGYAEPPTYTNTRSTVSQYNSNSLIALGLSANTTGTATADNVVTTNYFTQQPRTVYTTAATAGASASVRSQAQIFNGQNGYTVSIKFGVKTSGATTRGFVGLYATASAPANVEPNTFITAVGIGWNSGATVFSIMSNDASGTATSVALSTDFPANSTGAAYYELVLTQAAGVSAIGYTLRRLDNTAIPSAIGTITTDLPPLTTLLASHVWINNGATAETVSLSFTHFITKTN